MQEHGQLILIKMVFRGKYPTAVTRTHPFLLQTFKGRDAMLRSPFLLVASLIAANLSCNLAFTNCNGLIKSGSFLKVPMLKNGCRVNTASFLTKLRLSEVLDETDEAKQKDQGFFFLRNPLDRERDRRDGRPTFTRVPKDPSEVSCACGSKRTYANCCQKFHESGEAPDDPVNLIRARYSAFAYRLPGYIMRTTAQGSSEWKINQNQWEREILGFCDGWGLESCTMILYTRYYVCQPRVGSKITDLYTQMSLKLFWYRSCTTLHTYSASSGEVALW